jgi:hypothetical protein
VNGAEMPNRTSVSVTPRMVGALAVGPSIVATRAGAALVGCGAADAIEGPAVGGAAFVGCEATDAIGGPAVGGAALVGCGIAEAIRGPAAGDAALVGCEAEAIGRRAAGELTSVGGFWVSSLNVASVVLVPNPNACRHVAPSTMYNPIAVPNATAQTMVIGHQGFQEVNEEEGKEGGLELMISGLSDLRQSFASFAGISFSAPVLPCLLADRKNLGNALSGAPKPPCGLTGRTDFGA